MKKRKTAKLDQGRLAAARIRLVHDREPGDPTIRANGLGLPGSGHDKRGHRVGLQPVGAVIFRIVSSVRPRHN